LKEPLKSILAVPIIYEDQIIGVVEVYNKVSRDEVKEGFSQEDQEILRGLSEHIGIAMTKLNLIQYDALTGLPNRSLLLVKANQAIAAAARTRTPLAVLFVDLDRFKQINDSLGHQAGDELLRIIATRLQAEARKSDIVGRLSGDEFVIVLSQCDLHWVTEVVKRLQDQLAQPCHIAGVALTPSASIGIALFPDNGDSIEILLHRADMAMYQAKEKIAAASASSAMK